MSPSLVRTGPPVLGSLVHCHHAKETMIQDSVALLVCLFETESQVSLAGLELAMYPRVNVNVRCSHLCLLSTGIINIGWGLNPGLCSC